MGGWVGVFASRIHYPWDSRSRRDRDRRSEGARAREGEDRRGLKNKIIPSAEGASEQLGGRGGIMTTASSSHVAGLAT